MIIKELENTKQSGIYPVGGKNWDCFYDTSQKFRLQLTAENDSDLGSWGLTQTLKSSTRVASYNEHVKLVITTQRTPCLDGNDLMIPWYNEASKAKKLKAIGDSIELKIEDSPGASGIPSQAKRRTGVETAVISKLEFDEAFLVTLYKIEGETKLKQWKWSYKFTLAINGNNVYNKPEVTTDETTKMEVNVNIEPIVLIEPVATDKPNLTWTDGWEGVE